MLETDEQIQTKVDVGDLIAKKNNLQPPVLPVDFVDQVMLCDSADFLMRWLSDNVPLNVRTLFNDILFAGMFKSAYYENGGKVPQDLNEAVLENLQESLNIQAALGQTW
jgi:hypothetical protein